MNRRTGNTQLGVVWLAMAMSCAESGMQRANDDLASETDPLVLFADVSYRTSVDEACAELETLCEANQVACAAFEMFCAPETRRDWSCLGKYYGCREGQKVSACQRFVSKCQHMLSDAGTSSDFDARSPLPDAQPDAGSPPPDTQPDAGSSPPDTQPTTSCPPDAIFCDGFEKGNLSASTNGFAWAGTNNTAVVQGRARSGNYSLRFRFGPDGNGSDSWVEQRFHLGGHYKEIWVHYQAYIPSNYTHRSQSGSANNKGWLFLWSGDYGAPSGPGMGPNFWPTGGGKSAASFHVWSPIDRHYWPDETVWANSGRVIEDADLGAWYEVYLHYKYASRANNDGVAQIWKRRPGREWVKLLEIADGGWYMDGQPGFDQGYLWGWSNSGFAAQTDIFIDDIVFSKNNYLGL